MQVSNNLHAPAALPAVEKPSVPTEKPSVPTEKPSVPTEKPSVPTEKPSVPTEKKAEGGEGKFRLDAVEKIQIPCFSRESNRGPSVVQPVD